MQTAKKPGSQGPEEAPAATTARVALFGGTFDPIHQGHLAVAKAAIHDLRYRLDSIEFVPAAKPPFKEDQALAPYEDRCRMLEIALEGEREPRFHMSRLEAPENVSPDKPNYTIDTVRRFKATRQPQDQLYFILGVDSFQHFAKWRDPDSLLNECKLIVASRPGYYMGNALAALPATLHHLRANILLLESVHADISSTAVRDGLRAGKKAVEAEMPVAVMSYIREHGLYR